MVMNSIFVKSDSVNNNVAMFSRIENLKIQK